MAHRFWSGFSDGTYAYFVPYYGPSGKAVRIAANDFTSSGVTVLDLAATDSTLKG